ncbi:MAG: aspartate/glutamate racemase family protein [Faecousia sp.]
MKKLFFIYTNPRFMTALYDPVMARTYDGNPDVKVSYLLDHSILTDTIANNTVPTPSVENRLGRLIANCEEAGADCVVVGCTAMNLATLKLAEKASVPVISVDEPMVRRIAADGCGKVAILSHAGDNAETIRRRLEAYGVDCGIFVVPGAREVMGDREAFAALFEKTAASLPGEYDAIALGHISADDIPFEGVKQRVYRSGRECIREINRVLNL